MSPQSDLPPEHRRTTVTSASYPPPAENILSACSDRKADCRCAKLPGSSAQQYARCFSTPFFQQDAERTEFLTKRHRYGVPQLGTTHFTGCPNRFTFETFTQLVDGIDQFDNRGVNRYTEACRRASLVD